MRNRAIEVYLRKNWKTTLTGLISAIACYFFIDHTLGDVPLTYKFAQWAFMIGIATNGAVAKDAD